MKFNPAFLEEGELVAGFVARSHELRRLVDIIRDNSGASNQHVLILGPRGYGKTTLLLRLAAEIHSDVELSRGWYPIVFSEEVEVATPGELWAEAIFFLARQTDEPQFTETYKALRLERDETRLRELALAELRGFAARENKRLIIEVENLHTIFSELLSPDDAWIIRHTLQNEPSFMLVTTSTVRFDAIQDPGQALYELFHVIELEPLSAAECACLFSHLGGAEIDPLRGRALQILTGGNPRLLVILSRFTTGASLTSLVDDFSRLIDDHSDYFKGNIDALPATERRIFAALAELWTPATAHDVAAFARMDVNKASALLSRLARRGLVSALPHSPRRKRYQVSERLYNIYWVMRRHGRESDRVRFVVDFIAAYYDMDFLTETCLVFANEALVRQKRDRSLYVHSFYQLLPRLPAEYRARVHKRLSQEFFALPESPHAERRLVTEERARFLASPPRKSAAADAAAAAEWMRDRIDQRPCLQQLEELVLSDSTIRRIWTSLVASFKEEASEDVYTGPVKELFEYLPGCWEQLQRRLLRFVKTAHRGRELTTTELFVVGGLAFALDDEKTTLRLARHLAKRYPNSPWAHLIVFVLRNEFGYLDEDQCRLEVRQLCERYPERLDIPLALGLLLYDVEDVDYARSLVQRAVSPDMVCRLVSAVLDIRDDLLAVEHEIAVDPRWRPVMAFLDDSHWSEITILLYQFSRTFHDSQTATEVLALAAVVLPQSFEIQARLALSSAASRDVKRELAALKRASEIDAGSPELLLALGVQLALRQEYSLARVLISKSWHSYVEACAEAEDSSLHLRVHEWIKKSAESVPEAPLLSLFQHLSEPDGTGILENVRLMVRSDSAFAPHHYVYLACASIVAQQTHEFVLALRESPTVRRLEPLLLALAKLHGENPSAPAEVEEIANDIGKTFGLVTDLEVELRGTLVPRAAPPITGESPEGVGL